MIKQITPLGGSTAHDLSTRYMHSPDTRATVINPNELVATKNGVQFDFKQASVTGLTGYSGVLSYRPYASNSDWTGGPAHQIAFNNSNGLYWRVSTGDTTWGDWKQLVTNSGTWGISITGNAATADKLKTARTISLTGAVTGSASFNGSANISIATTSNHNHDSVYVKKSGDTMTGQLYINYDQDVGLNQNGSLIIGNKAGSNIAIDSNEIMARNNSAASTLYLNTEGGDIVTSAMYPYAAGKILGGTGTAHHYYKLYLGGGTTQSNAINAANPLIEFCNSDRSQYGQLVYTDFDAIRAPDGLTWVGNQANSWFQAPRIFGAVWNDYAEYRETKEDIEPGRCIVETGNGDLILSTERLQEGCEVVSDTFGFAIGETKICKTPTACAGRVLVYLYEDNTLAKPGRPVCSGPNGTVSLMTNEEAREYPWCIIGTISEIPNYDEWEYGSADEHGIKNKLKVNGRIWIRIR